MYVYMLKVLHNEWNIDLIFRLQKFNAVKKIQPWTIPKKKKNFSYNENRFFIYVRVSNIMLILELDRLTKW